MAKIQLNALALKAVSRIVPSQDIRYYLNGVCIEATKESTTLVSTDGHRIMAVCHKAENDIEENARIIIPKEIVLMLLTGKKRDPQTIELEQQGEKWSAGLPPCNEFQVQFKPIPGNFPHWKALVKKTVENGLSGETAMYNARYLQELFAAAKDLDSTRYSTATLLHNGDGAGIIRFGENMNEFKVIALVMPMKFDAIKELPDLTWAYPEEDEADEADKTKEATNVSAVEEVAA